MHTNGVYTQKISRVADLHIARSATPKGSLYHARAYRIPVPVCSSALWGGAQAGAVSFRRESARHGDMPRLSSPGLGGGFAGPNAGRSFAGSSVRQRAVPGAMMGPFRRTHLRLVGAAPDLSGGLCRAFALATEQEPCAAEVFRQGHRHCAGSRAHRSRDHGPNRLLGRRVCLRGTHCAGRKTCAPGASIIFSC